VSAPHTSVAETPRIAIAVLLRLSFARVGLSGLGALFGLQSTIVEDIELSQAEDTNEPIMRPLPWLSGRQPRVSNRSATSRPTYDRE
jgi:hypothetical protein